MKDINVRFIDDWKEDKQLAVFNRLIQTIPENIRSELTKEEKVVPVTLYDSYEYAKSRKNSLGLMTGIDRIDHEDYLAGLCPGSLYVVGGSTGVGKTMFVCNLVLGVVLRENVKTLFLTTEMPNWSVTKRLRVMWKSFLNDEDAFSSLPIEYVDNNQDISIEVIRQLIKEQEYKFVVVDNLQWFSRGGANMAESTGLATQALKKMAIEFDIPIILVSHLNRMVYAQDNPDLNSLKNSSYIEQDADAVILLSRNTDGEAESDYRPDVTKVALRKNRLTGNLFRIFMISNSNNVLSIISENDAKRKAPPIFPGKK